MMFCLSTPASAGTVEPGNPTAFPFKDHLSVKLLSLRLGSEICHSTSVDWYVILGCEQKASVHVTQPLSLKGLYLAM